MQIVLITGAILFFQSECINAQAWKKLKEKASSKVSNKLNKNKKTSENTSSSNTPNQSNQTENTSTNSTNQEAKNKVELKKKPLRRYKG